jgi:hypothetical protein
VYDHEHVVTIATEIIAWQAAAQQLPLPDLRAILATSLDHLADGTGSTQEINLLRRVRR